jgi:AbrB family looped-hinge helix DNA binding protein
MAKVKMDEEGRILIPVKERDALGLKAGTEFEVVFKGNVLVLKPILPKPLRVDGTHRKWGKEAFLSSGEATFGK